MDLTITPLGPDRFSVQITEGSDVNSLVVEAEPTELADMGFDGIDSEVVVREALLALLDRLPAPRIADTGSLPLAPLLRIDMDIAEEVGRRVGASPTAGGGEAE